MKAYMLTTEKIDINGIVQGVGFRPFIYNLAKEMGIKGYVLNNPQGVLIIAQAPKKIRDQFIKNIETQAPPLSRINEIMRSDLANENQETFSDFSIRESQNPGKPTTLISPDVCPCENCLNELFDPKDRRHHYPFINCTNCGPRFTIIQDLPYDRPFTTMSKFTLCQTCQAEYDKPEDRRFHAQPNACDLCGPHLSLTDSLGNEIKGDPMLKAIELIKQGKIIAIKALGGFQLACDATNDDAVQRLRERKKRDEKPFAIMCGDLEDVKTLAALSIEEEMLLESRERPIVIVARRTSHVSRIGQAVAPDNPYLGVMLPSTPLHYLLYYHSEAGGDFTNKKATFPALVMTSGNISEEPIIKNDDEAFKRLAPVVDAFLTHDRPIHVRCDDSILRLTNDKPKLIRRARGFAPAPIFTKLNYPPILAVGAELKNTLCITDNNRAFVSQYIGDLENIPTLDYFAEAIDHFKSILNIDPKIIAYDLHPEYLSTKYVMDNYSPRETSPSTPFRVNDVPFDSAQGKRPATRVPVQHHHAHIASVMAEHDLIDPVIGFSCDGTGYGLDETIWGGEVLICSPTNFFRAAHLRQVPLPGGSKAIKEPWRMALAYLKDSFGPEALDLPLDSLKQISKSELLILNQAIDKKLNAPLTSSLGRLFDAISSLLNIKHTVSFEGQAAMMLEALATNNSSAKKLPYEIREKEIQVFPDYLNSHQDTSLPTLKNQLELDYRPLIRNLVQEMIGDTSLAILAKSFHLSLISSFLEIAQIIRKNTGIQTVALSGGSWQNQILSQKMTKELKNQGFTVYTNELVPVNDGGISLGQAYIAATSCTYDLGSRNR
jgi:hydrogenase maturation protein HypF